MPTKRIEHVDLPFAQRRYTPNYGPLAALYLRAGEDLAGITLRKGATQAQTMQALAGLFSNYHETGRRQKAAEAEAMTRQRERAEDRADREAERQAAEAERKRDREDRQRNEERAAMRYAVDNVAPGPTSPALAEAARRFPELAARFSTQETLPARPVVPGYGNMDEAGGQSYPVLEPNAEQIERSRAMVTAAKNREEDIKARTAAQAAEDAYRRQVFGETTRHNQATEAIQSQNAAAALANARARLGGGETTIKPSLRNALERVMSNIPMNRRAPKLAHAQRLFDEGNEKELKDFIRLNAVESEPVDSRNLVTGRMATVASLKDTLAVLNELKARGVDTNIVRGTWEDFLRGLGKTSDPDLVALRNRLQGTLINYRRAATGVAFGEREGQQYEKMFPNYKNELPVNEALIRGLMREMETYDRTFWEHKLGPDGAAEILGQPSTGGRPRVLSIVPVPKP